MKYFPHLTLAAALLFSSSLYAAEAPGKDAYGLVKEITNNQMTVTVYDTESGQAHEEQFALDPKTQLTIVRPASEVIAGDEVKITYLEEGNNKKASFVSIIDLPAPAEAKS